MLTKQEQKILDNAPEGTTHYTHGLGYYKDIEDMTYAYYGTEKPSLGWRSGTGEPAFDCFPLADLRKKQGKTVWDAVNKLKGSLTTNSNGIKIMPLCWSVNEDGVKCKGDLICTIEEFNQCVDDLAMFANLPSTVGATEWCYKQHKLDNPVAPIETKLSAAVTTLNHLGYKWCGGEQWKPPLGDTPEYIKPRTKVEHVKVVGLAFWEVAREYQERKGTIFYKIGDNFTLVKTLDSLVKSHKMGNIYRKAETEITWQNELDSFLARSEITAYSINDNAEVKLTGWLNSKQFIEMCHLVSSMANN